MNHYLDELYLLTGKPIPIANVGKVHHLTLEEIAEIGMDEFNAFLGILIFEIEDLEIDIPVDGITTFDMIAANCIQNIEFRNKIETALCRFFKEKVAFHNDYGIFYLEELEKMRFISRDNYEDVKRAIRAVSFASSEKDKPEKKFASEMARRIYEQQQKAKEQLDKLKKRKGGTSPDLVDLISAFCVYTGFSILEIWKLSLFQFMNQFYRTQLVEDYDIKIKSLLAGANPDEIEVKHYTSKIEKE